MEVAVQIPETPDRSAVALKAYARVIDAWRLPLKDAAALADMSESTWKRAKKPGYAASLTQDQLLRLSAIIGIYKSLRLYFGDTLADRWISLPNDGPLFDGARPLETMLTGGLPQFLQVRRYLDALRGGA